MNIQTESTLVTKTAEMPVDLSNQMQERHIRKVNESTEVAAEAIFAARKLEVQKEAGQGSSLLFVP